MLAAATAWTLLMASAAQEASVELPSKWDARMLELQQQAVETAFLQQIALLYSTWMKDYSRNEPHRVATGARNARAAYIHAMQQIEAKRK